MKCKLVFLLIAGTLVFGSGGCKPNEQKASSSGVSGTPKTSFGKAVDSAKKVRGASQERAERLTKQAEEAGEE